MSAQSVPGGAGVPPTCIRLLEAWNLMRETLDIYCHFYHEVKGTQRAEFLLIGVDWGGFEFCWGPRSKDTGSWQQADTFCFLQVQNTCMVLEP